jgi:hypothetical protein
VLFSACCSFFSHLIFFKQPIKEFQKPKQKAIMEGQQEAEEQGKANWTHEMLLQPAVTDTVFDKLGQKSVSFLTPLW